MKTHHNESHNLIEDLKKYFETTPKETVLENWAKSETFDEIGPTMDEFLNITNSNNVKDRWDVQLILNEGYDLIGVSLIMGYDTYVFSNSTDARICYEKLEIETEKLSGWFYDLPGWAETCKWYKNEFNTDPMPLILI